MERFKMWIGGEWVDSVSGKTFSSVNPATGEVIAEVPLGDREDAKRAINAARKAFPQWSKLPQSERSKKVSKIAELLMGRLEEFAKLETADHGSPMRKTMNFDIPISAGTFEYFAQASRDVVGHTLPVGPHVLCYTTREPIGVISAITPWNAPLLMASWKLGAALVTGNTCVIKPASVTPLTTLKLGEILEQLDLPPGAVNIITGPGNTVGQEMVENPGVDKVGFTGSSETGREVLGLLGKGVKRVGLELGGNNPFIVFDDADVDAAVQGAVFASFFNNGQVCAATGRYYVQEKVYEEFLGKFVAESEKLVVGDPLDMSTDMGPVVSAGHRDSIESYIASGLEEGASVVLGGRRPSGGIYDKGYYVSPTIFANVRQDMRIVREEIFGPVAPVMPFKDEEEVIRLANDTDYGLSASVWTNDVRRAINLSNAIDAGTTWINEHLIIWFESPWGGFKQSGFGKDLSRYVLEEYTRLKAVSVDLTGMKKKPWYNLINPR